MAVSGHSGGMLSGIFPAVTSLFDEGERFLEEDFARLLSRLYRAGVDGVYVCGLNGSGHRMRPDERKRAAEIAVHISRQHSGKAIIHVGSSNSRDAVDLAQHAARTGAHAVAAIPPPDAGHAQLLGYYGEIAEAASLPVLVYYYPALLRHDPSFSQISELLELPGIAGLKLTDWNLFLLRRLRLGFPQAALLSGYDQILLPALLYGADGGIGSWCNALPALFVAIYRAFRCGDYPGAICLQERLLSFLDWVSRHGRDPVFESVMRDRGFGPHCFRRPRTELEPGAAGRCRAELHDALEPVREFLLPSVDC